MPSFRRHLIMYIASLILAAAVLLSGQLALAKLGDSKIRITTASPTDRGSALAVLSADGTKVAFYSNADFLGEGIPANQIGLWLYDTATMTLTRIVTLSTWSANTDYPPSLNANGSKVAFNIENEIWLYDTDAMTLTRIITVSEAGRGSWYPSLSADGSKVAFYSNADFLNQGILDNQHEIWLYDTTSMTLTRITIASDSYRESWIPSLSADGTKVAFESDSDLLGQGILDQQFNIWLYDTTTMTLTRITADQEIGRGSIQPGLSADGRKVAFLSDADFLGQGIPAGQAELWLFDTDTMTLTRIATAWDKDSDQYFFIPSLSADGSKIAFESNSDFLGQGIQYQSEIWLFDTNTMTLTRVTSASEAGRSSRFPSLSADGSKVAFNSVSDFLDQGLSNQYEIWLFTDEPIDTAPPDTAITASPPDPDNDPTPAFEFNGDDGSGSGVVAFACQLNGGGWTACSSPYTAPSLSDGPHTFAVRAIDNTGNIDPSPAGYSWTVDLSPPLVSAVSPAAGSAEVPANSPLVIDFSEAMDTAGLSYLISPTVTGLVETWDNGHTRLTVSQTGWAANTRYTATVSAGGDRAGNLLANAPYSWVFTTSAAAAPEADLALAKTRLGTGAVIAGEPITYSLTISNAGPTGPVTATVVDTFSPAAALVAVDGAGCGWSIGSAVVTCTVTNIPADGAVELTLVVTSSSVYSGSLSNSASVAPAEGVIDQNPTNNEAGPVAVTILPVYDGQMPLYLPLLLKD